MLPASLYQACELLWNHLRATMWHARPLPSLIYRGPHALEFAPNCNPINSVFTCKGAIHAYCWREIPAFELQGVVDLDLKKAFETITRQL